MTSSAAIRTDPVDTAVSGPTLKAGEASRDAQFVALMRAFRRSGGLAREIEIVEKRALCRSPADHGDGCREAAICFEWGGRFWLPWFQFDRARMSLRPGPAKVIEELAPVFDGWEMASWFAQPNLWIGDARPIDRIDGCLASVFGAARADRSIAAAARPERQMHGQARASTIARIDGQRVGLIGPSLSSQIREED